MKSVFDSLTTTDPNLNLKREHDIEHVSSSSKIFHSSDINHIIIHHISYFDHINNTNHRTQYQSFLSASEIADILRRQHLRTIMFQENSQAKFGDDFPNKKSPPSPPTHTLEFKNKFALKINFFLLSLQFDWNSSWNFFEFYRGRIAEIAFLCSQL